MSNVQPPKTRTVKEGVPVNSRTAPRRLTQAEINARVWPTADEIKAMLPPIDESRMVRETFSGQIMPGQEGYAVGLKAAIRSRYNPPPTIVDSLIDVFSELIHSIKGLSYAFGDPEATDSYIDEESGLPIKRMGPCSQREDDTNERLGWIMAALTSSIGGIIFWLHILGII